MDTDSKSPEDYRRKAAELRKHAANVKQPAIKEEYLILAGQYEELAASLEYALRIEAIQGEYRALAHLLDRPGNTA
jgi:hypothetical protein